MRALEFLADRRLASCVSEPGLADGDGIAEWSAGIGEPLHRSVGPVAGLIAQVSIVLLQFLRCRPGQYGLIEVRRVQIDTDVAVPQRQRSGHC